LAYYSIPYTHIFDSIHINNICHKKYKNLITIRINIQESDVSHYTQMANSASNDIIKSLQSASEEILASRPNPNEEDNYELRAKVCTRLSREICSSELQFVVQELSQKDGNEWTAPSKPGLENCDEIIPSYYHFHKHPSKIMDIDYFEIIKDDVRNYRVLNHRQLLYINNLTHEEKNELIRIFNDCIQSFNTMIQK